MEYVILILAIALIFAWVEIYFLKQRVWLLNDKVRGLELHLFPKPIKARSAIETTELPNEA